MMVNNVRLGLGGIFNKYTARRNFMSYKNLVLLVVSIGVSIWLFVSKDLAFIYSFLGTVVNIFMSSIPDLLGFCIGGYAIIIAMNSLDKMPAIIEPQPSRNNMSYYHILSADFAMTLVMMCALLLGSYALSFVYNLELSAVNDVLGKVANLTIITLFIWLGLLVAMMLLFTVINLFNTSIILQTVASITGPNEEDQEEISPNMTIYKVDTLFGHFTITKLESKKK